MMACTLGKGAWAVFCVRMRCSACCSSCFRGCTVLDCRILEVHSEPDACRWLPGARFNIAECALSGEPGSSIRLLRGLLVSAFLRPPGPCVDGVDDCCRFLPQGPTQAAQPSCGQTRRHPPSFTA